MSEQEPNPHLYNSSPGSWDPPFKRWVIGVGLAIFLVHLGSKDLLSGIADVPVPEQGYGRGYQWMKVEGIGAYSFGLAQIGLAMFLHGRYFWRLHPSLWKFYPLLSGFGVIVCAVSVVTTYVLLWKTQLGNW